MNAANSRPLRAAAELNTTICFPNEIITNFCTISHVRIPWTIFGVDSLPPYDMHATDLSRAFHDVLIVITPASA